MNIQNPTDTSPPTQDLPVVSETSPQQNRYALENQSRFNALIKAPRKNQENALPSKPSPEALLSSSRQRLQAFDTQQSASFQAQLNPSDSNQNGQASTLIEGNGSFAEANANTNAQARNETPAQLKPPALSADAAGSEVPTGSNSSASPKPTSRNTADADGEAGADRNSRSTVVSSDTPDVSLYSSEKDALEKGALEKDASETTAGQNTSNGTQPTIVTTAIEGNGSLAEANANANPQAGNDAPVTASLVRNDAPAESRLDTQNSVRTETAPPRFDTLSSEAATFLKSPAHPANVAASDSSTDQQSRSQEGAQARILKGRQKRTAENNEVLPEGRAEDAGVSSDSSDLQPPVISGDTLLRNIQAQPVSATASQALSSAALSERIAQVSKLVESIRVATTGLADQGQVQIQLKGNGFEGTTVQLSLSGNQLRVDISAPLQNSDWLAANKNLLTQQLNEACPNLRSTVVFETSQEQSQGRARQQYFTDMDEDERA